MTALVRSPWYSAPWEVMSACRFWRSHTATNYQLGADSTHEGRTIVEAGEANAKSRESGKSMIRLEGSDINVLALDPQLAHGADP